MSGSALRFVSPFVLFGALVAAACSAETTEPTSKGGDTTTAEEDAGAATETPPAPAPWQDVEMQNLVATRCATCHSGSRVPNFKGITEEAMRANTKARDEVAAGRMPRGSAFTAAQKAVFANFYAQ